MIIRDQGGFSDVCGCIARLLEMCTHGSGAIIECFVHASTPERKRQFPVFCCCNFTAPISHVCSELGDPRKEFNTELFLENAVKKSIYRGRKWGIMGKVGKVGLLEFPSLGCYVCYDVLFSFS